MSRSAARRVLRVEPEGRVWRSDRLAVEEPLEIRIGDRPLMVTMRTPGDDFDLALGLLLAEGVIRRAADVRAIRTCEGKATGRHNVLEVELAPGVPPLPEHLQRRVATTSACGVCGRTSIDSLRARVEHDVAADPVRIDAAVLARLPETLRSRQRVFDRTGGLHAAALFTAAGELVDVREDVGRHNAFDKVIGRALGDGRVPLTGHVILASGRASFELTQKALVAGIPCLAAVSAPSSLAVELAGDSGMTLVGFLRGGSFNVYAGGGRIV